MWPALSWNHACCQLAPSPLNWPINCRLQLLPLNPAARSAALTCPCKPFSGLSPGPQVAFATATPVGVLSTAEDSSSSPPQPNKVIDAAPIMQSDSARDSDFILLLYIISSPSGADTSLQLATT